MTAFIVTGVVLVAGALLFVVLPLVRRGPRLGATRDAVNVAVYRDQLRELDADLRAGTLASDQYEKARREIEARLLTDECPRYRIEGTPRPQHAPPRPEPSLSDPNLRSRASVYRRYDHLVGSRTVRRPGFDAAVLRLRPSMRGLAVSLDGPPAGELDP